MTSGARYVLLGLAPARPEWFRDIGQWANAGSIPAEFIKCLSVEEARARLLSDRPFSALIVDATLPTLDRDLIDTAASSKCAVIVVTGDRPARDWVASGASAAIRAPFERKELTDALSTYSRMIGRADRASVTNAGDSPGWRAPVVAVTGPGGTGTSTVAIALAQGLGTDERSRGSVLLVDFRLRAELAMLHDARDVIPGIQEIVDAHRLDRPTAPELRSFTFAVPERGYHVVLGLRQPHAWATLRPRAFEAAFDGLRRAHHVVVADVDPDLEGEAAGGSVDVEERHVMSRTAMGQADLALVVGLPGMKGIHSLTNVVVDVLDFGVPAERVVPIVNRAPRSARSRAEVEQVLAELLPATARGRMPPPVFLPERRVDDALRDGVRLPESLVGPVVGAYRTTVGAAGARHRRVDPRPIPAGTVGAWTAQLGDGDLR